MSRESADWTVIYLAPGEVVPDGALDGIPAVNLGDRIQVLADYINVVLQRLNRPPATPDPVVEVANPFAEELYPLAGEPEEQPNDASPAPGGTTSPRPKLGQLLQIEELETKAHTLMERREKLLSHLKKSDVEAFAGMLCVGVEGRVHRLRDEVVNARRDISTSFSQFVDTVARVKAGEFYTQAMDDLRRRLEHPDESVAATLSDLVGRLGAFGVMLTPEAAARQILAKVAVFSRENTIPSASTDQMRRVLDAETRMEAAMLALKAVNRSREEMMKHAREQLSEIASLVFIEKIECSSGKLSISTGPAKIRYRWGSGQPDEERELVIGQFQMNFRLGGDSRAIHLKNLTYGERSAYQHPHVSGGSESQSICWGNIRESVLKLLSEWDFVTLIQLVWNFLNSYNSGDSYAKMDLLWPEWSGETLPVPEYRVRL